MIGYGKLGGMELGYGSDLDLVFLHDSSGAQQETEGGRGIDNQVFFLRFAQRMVHLLTMHSAAGRLYEVDMRLRPSGKGGLLITSIAGVRRLPAPRGLDLGAPGAAALRARWPARPTLRQRFEAVRARGAGAARAARAACARTCATCATACAASCRARKPGEFDLKQDPGGIADIEFLAQYWALTWAQDYPPVAMFSDTIRQLESVASADLVPQARVDVLTGTYRAYRTRLHHRALDGRGAVVVPARNSWPNARP